MSDYCVSVCTCQASGLCIPGRHVYGSDRVAIELRQPPQWTRLRDRAAPAGAAFFDRACNCIAGPRNKLGENGVRVNRSDCLMIASVKEPRVDLFYVRVCSVCVGVSKAGRGVCLSLGAPIGRPAGHLAAHAALVFTAKQSILIFFFAWNSCYSTTRPLCVKQVNLFRSNLPVCLNTLAEKLT